MGQTTFTGPVVSQNGFIENSFTTAQLLALPNPTEGLLVYNTTLNEYQVYNGSSFQPAFGPAAPIPVVNYTSPATVSTSGGPFDIYGSNFTGATAVTLGGTPAVSFFVVNDGLIQCASGPHPAGAVSVNVTTPAGTNGPNSLLTYVAVSVPVISSISQPGVSVFGGACNLTITGSNFTGVTTVSVGGNTAVGYTFIDDSTIGITSTPGGSAGATNVVVSTSAGASAPYSWSYFDTPHVVSVSPSSGSAAGGDGISVEGYALTNMTECQFIGATQTTNQTGISATNDNLVLFNTPAHVAEITSLQGYNLSYGYGPSSAPIYTFVEPPPTIAYFTKNGGSVLGGATSFNIYGSGFNGATSVTFQGNPSTFSVLGSSTIQVTDIPAGTVGSGNVVVTTPAGSSSPYTSWNYVDAPVITSIVPNAGAVAGGTLVDLYGYGFKCGREILDYVRFAGAAVSYSAYNSISDDTTASTVTDPHSLAELVNVAAGSNVTGGYGPDFVNGYAYVGPFSTPFVYDQGGTYYSAGGLSYEEVSPGSYELRIIPTSWISATAFGNITQMPSGFSGSLTPNNTGVSVPYTTLSVWFNAGSYWYCQVTIGGSLGSSVNIGVISG